jgi:beta-lactamase regulating signal transducer with metallopeptidase domain
MPVALDDGFARLLTASVQASVMAAVVWLVTTLAGRWISARWRCALWSLVFLRLVLPVLPPSPWTTTSMPMTVVANVLPKADVVTVTYGVIPDVAAVEVSSPPAQRTNWLPAAWLGVASQLLVRRGIAYALLVRRLRRLPRFFVAGMRAVETDVVSSPGVVGLVRPMLLLPFGLINRLTPAELAFVVAHERAHVRRGDLIAGAATALVTAIHWFNPLIWLAAARFRTERELACDEAVLRASQPQQRHAYGHTILRLLELAAQHRSPAGVVGVVSSGRRAIRKRIASIAAPLPRRSPLGAIALALVALTMLTAPRERAEAGAEVRATAPTNPQATGVDDPANTLTRVYDVRDLLVDIPDYTPPDFEPHEVPTTRRSVATETPASKPSTQTYRDAATRLMADITGTIDTRSWRNNAGSVGSIQELQGQLIVTQTARNHERIMEKLQAMRGARGVQVTLETRILSGLHPEQALGEPGWEQRVETPATPGSHQLWPRFLTDAEVERLLRATQADQNTTLMHRAAHHAVQRPTRVRPRLAADGIRRRLQKKCRRFEEGLRAGR